MYVIDIAWQSVLYGIYNPESRGRSPRARVVYSIQHVTAMLHLIYIPFAYLRHLRAHYRTTLRQRSIAVTRTHVPIPIDLTCACFRALIVYELR